MLQTPPSCFRIFHRHLPTMEILVYGKTGDANNFHVMIQSMDVNMEFSKELTPTETLKETLHAIIYKAHETLFQFAEHQKLEQQEDGKHVH